MSYTIQQADIIQHKKWLISLWQENLQDFNSDRFSWIYENNPNGSPRVFLLKHEESQTFIGAISLFPRPILYKGTIVQSYICGDMVVDSRHRSLGPASTLLKATLKHCDQENPCILISLPNEKSEPVALRVGYKVLGEYCEFVKVLKTRKYLLRYLNSQTLAALLAWPIDIFLHCRYEAFFNVIKSRKYNCEIMTEFDPRFDLLWNKLKNNHDLIGLRNSEFLNWRLRQTPYGKCDIFTIISKYDKSLCGYIAYRYNSLRASIVDIASVDGCVGFNILLFLFSEFMMNNGADSISISLACSDRMQLEIENLGYCKRSVKNKVVIHGSFLGDNIVCDIIKSNWYITKSDNDV